MPEQKLLLLKVKKLQKEILESSIFHKNQRKKSSISALALKSGSIKRMNPRYYTNRAEIREMYCWYFDKLKTQKCPPEIF